MELSKSIWIWEFGLFCVTFNYYTPSKTSHCVRFEVFMAVTMKNAIFWDVEPCISCVNRRFEGTYHLHIQSRKNPRERNQGEQVAADCSN
jgi:hypothetical protein